MAADVPWRSRRPRATVARGVMVLNASEKMARWRPTFRGEAGGRERRRREASWFSTHRRTKWHECRKARNQIDEGNPDPARLANTTGSTGRSRRYMYDIVTPSFTRSTCRNPAQRSTVPPLPVHVGFLARRSKVSIRDLGTGNAQNEFIVCQTYFFFWHT